jgi:hypothetical protein
MMPNRLRCRFVVRRPKQSQFERAKRGGRRSEVDQHTLCTQDGAGHAGWPHETQEWSDHGRAGDHQHRGQHDVARLEILKISRAAYCRSRR